EIICLKCLEKAPERRYVSAEELANDLARFRADEPIRARPTSTVARLWKWARRKPAVAVLGTLAFVAIVAGLGAGIWQYYQNVTALHTARTHLYCNSIGLARSHLAANRVRRAEQILDDCPADLRGWE